MKLIAPYMKQNKELLKLWSSRDNSVISCTKPLVNSSHDLTINPLFQKNYNNKYIAIEQINNNSILMNFNNHDSSEPHRIRVPLPNVDFSGMKELELDLQLMSSSTNNPGYIRILILDKFNQERYAHFKIQKNKTTYKINAQEILGIHIDETSITSINFIFGINLGTIKTRGLMIVKSA